MRSELLTYKTQLSKHMNHLDAVRSLSCRFCPFRKFSKKILLLGHVNKFHVAPHYTAETVAARSKKFMQYKVAAAFYQQYMLQAAVRTSPFEHDLLTRSAAAIRRWNHSASTTELDVLQK